jgi:hypothetical protein
MHPSSAPSRPERRPSPLRRSAIVALLLLPLAACGGQTADGPEILSGTPTMRIACEVVIQGARARVADGPVGYVHAGATQRAKVLAINEADARRQFQAAGVGTRERPCLRVSRERL